MASTILVKDLLWRATVLLGEAANQWGRFPENELVRWLIDAQVEIVKLMPSAGVRIDAIKLAAGTRQSIDTVLAASCQPGDGIALTAPLYGIQLLALTRNMGADGLTVGKSINIVDRQALANINEDWHTTSGTSVQDYVFDERAPAIFYVYPGVTPVMWVEAMWMAMPKVIPNTGAVGTELYSIGGSSTQTIMVQDKFVGDLVNYILGRAQLKDSKFAEATKTQLYMKWFYDSLNAQTTALTKSNPNVQILAGETRP